MLGRMAKQNSIANMNLNFRMKLVYETLRYSVCQSRYGVDAAYWDGLNGQTEPL